MINGQKLTIVMPAYNAAATLQKTFNDLPHDIVDEVILVDDHSRDQTIEVARTLGISVIIRHNKNLGYGGNQKTCYTVALERGADIIIMIHPDYQYTPKLAGAMAWMIASGEYDMVLGSRILGKGARAGGMPLWRYVANRFLTAFENIFVDVKLSEYHTGYRAYSRQMLETLPIYENSDNFVFDNQIITQAVALDFRIGEMSCPTRYMPEASSINFSRSVAYGFGVLGTSLSYWLHTRGISKFKLYDPAGRKATDVSAESRGQVFEV